MDLIVKWIIGMGVFAILTYIFAKIYYSIEEYYKRKKEEHPVCPECGYCIPCGDCAKWHDTIIKHKEKIKQEMNHPLHWGER